MSATQQSADEADDDSFEYYPQVKQHPHTIITGEIVDAIVPRIDSDVENPGTSVGVVFENPTVSRGTLWETTNVPDAFDTASEFADTLELAAAEPDGTTNYVRDTEVTEATINGAREELVAAGVIDSTDADIEVNYSSQGKSATINGTESISIPGADYKVADPTDQQASVTEVGGQTLGIDVGSGPFESEQVDAFDSERVMVWYGGITGQFVMQALDFNGRPSVRYKDDGYLMKGLLQHPIGWFERDVQNFDSVPTTDRSELASADGLGRPPRPARPLVLRDDLTGEQFIELGRLNGGQMFEVSVCFNDFDGDAVEEATEIEPNYDPNPEEVLASEFENPSEVYELYHGDGWQNKPDNAQPIVGEGADNDVDTSGASFDISVNADESVEHPTDTERAFGERIAEQLAGTGVSPDEPIFGSDDDPMALEGLVEANADNFDVDPDVDAIREVIYENTAHLDTDDL